MPAGEWGPGTSHSLGERGEIQLSGILCLLCHALFLVIFAVLLTGQSRRVRARGGFGILPAAPAQLGFVNGVQSAFS